MGARERDAPCSRDGATGGDPLCATIIQITMDCEFKCPPTPLVHSYILYIYAGMRKLRIKLEPRKVVYNNVIRLAHRTNLAIVESPHDSIIVV